MIQPIPDDATEVAYFSEYKRIPRIVKIHRKTATMVMLNLAWEGVSETAFYKANGRKRGAANGWSGEHIQPVTPQVLDWIESVKLAPEVRRLELEVQKAVHRLTTRGSDSRSTEGTRNRIALLERALATLTAMYEEANHDAG